MARKLGDLMLDIDARLGKLESKLRRAEAATKASGVRQKKAIMGIKKAWLAIGAGVALAIIGFKKMIRVAADFEQAIANVKSVSGGSQKALAKLAREAGKNTVFSATEAADALYFLASAGLDVTEMSKVLEPALNLAAAAQMGIAEATDLVVNNLKVFGAEMSDAEKFTDIMATTVKSTNTDMQQLGEALGYAAPAAKVAGVDFKDLNVILGALADRGIKGAKAGVQMRMAMARLTKPTSGAEAALAKYGISTDEITKLLPTPIKLFQRLHDANLSNADALSILGVRQTGVFALIKDGMGTVDKLSDKMENYEGTSKEMAKTQITTVAGSLKLLKSKFQELILYIMSDAMPGLRKFITTLGDAVSKLTDYLGQLGKYGGQLSDHAKQILTTGKNYKFQTEATQAQTKAIYEASKAIEKHKAAIAKLEEQQTSSIKKFLGVGKVEKEITVHRLAAIKLEEKVKAALKELGITSIKTSEQFKKAYEGIRQEIQDTKDEAIEADKEIKAQVITPEAAIIKPEEKKEKEEDEFLVKVEGQKAVLEDYYSYVDDKRELDLMKEEEAYENSLIALQEKLIRDGVVSVEARDQIEELETIHKEKMLAIDLKYSDGVIDNQQKILNFTIKVGKDIRNKFIASTSDAVTEMIFQGNKLRKSWSQVFKDIAIQIGKMIVKLFIAKALKIALGGPLGAFFNKGGKVGDPVYAAKGYGPKGSDNIPAWLTKGERVLTVGDNELLENFMQRFSRVLSVPALPAGSAMSQISSNNTTTNNERTLVLSGDININQPPGGKVMDEIAEIEQATSSTAFRR